ncbi:MAG: asparagine synthetase B, partial [Spirochaetota bacterium]|nr:asparagine synthetase B [Spirochaetota bacterium]
MKKMFFYIGFQSVFIFVTSFLMASSLLVPMDKTQNNHLKAYGLVYYILSTGYKGEWLLNYRGGSFLFPGNEEFKEKAAFMNVSYIFISEAEKKSIYKTIETKNMHRIELNKAPRVAVYSPPDKEPWDDAVTLVLTYAEIPYDIIWDKEVISGSLSKYDWLHLHHEDFTGQYGKFYGMYKKVPWYLKKVITDQKNAKGLGFESVQKLKCAVAKKIKEYVNKGGFLFAMCSATDTLDIALAADGVDIIEKEIDGTPVDKEYQSKINFSNCLAFNQFIIYTDPNVYEYSSIDVDINKEGLRVPDTFQLFEFSAKIDPIPTMLNQNHVQVIKGFLGQTTAFYRQYVKPHITVLGETIGTNRVKYI